MEKNEKYIAPECEEIRLRIETGILVGSDPNEGGGEGVGGGEED